MQGDTQRSVQPRGYGGRGPCSPQLLKKLDSPVIGYSIHLLNELEAHIGASSLFLLIQQSKNHWQHSACLFILELLKNRAWM